MASGTPPPTFLGIPVELRLRILELPALDIRDIIRCMLVCRDLRDLLNGSTLYTYKRELERCSMVDNSPDYPISTKLEKLLDRNRRWRDLDAFSVKTLEVPFVSGPISLLGGIFARTVRGSNKRDLDIGLLVLPKGDGDVEDIIPEGQNWGEVIEAIAIDPEQDLLVVVNGVQQDYYLHLRTLFSQDPHPLAANARLALPPSRQGSYQVKLAGDIIVVERPEDGKASIFNWHTGHFYWDSTCYNDTLALLSSELFVIVRTDYIGKLNLFAIDKEEESVSCIATLLLPELIEENQLEDTFELESISVESSPVGGPGPAAMFKASPNHGLLVFTYEGESYRGHHGFNDGRALIYLLVGTDGLFRVAEELLKAPGNQTIPPLTPPAYKWTEWAVNNIKCFDVVEHRYQEIGEYKRRLQGLRAIFDDVTWDGSWQHTDAYVATFTRPTALDEATASDQLLFREAEDKFKLASRIKVKKNARQSRTLPLCTRPLQYHVKEFKEFGYHLLDENHIFAIKENPDFGISGPAEPTTHVVQIWSLN